MLISAIGFSINIFFSALAYSAYVPTLIALSMVAASMGEGDGKMSARPIR
jgi:general stress protein CsbA